MLRIALLQIAPTGTLAGNLEKGMAACRPGKYHLLMEERVEAPFIRTQYRG